MTSGPSDERIDIEVVMSDMTSPTAENVERKIKDIGDESETSAGKVEDLGVQTDETGKKWRRFGLTLRKNRADLRNASTDVEGTRRKVKGLGDEVEKTEKKVAKSTKGMKNSFGGMFAFLKKISRPLMFGIKWGLIADGVGFLATALKGLGAAGYAAVAGLSPLVGLLGAYPGILAVAGQSMIAFKMATSGVGEAIKVMSDPEATVEAYAAATKDLHKNQIKFAQSVATTTDVWKAMRKEVGGEFFDKVGPLYMSLTQKYAPLFNKQLKISAGIWNDLILNVGDFLDSKAGLELVGDVMENNNKAMAAGSDGMSSTFQLLLWTLRAAGPMVTSIAGDFTDMMNRGANWAENNQREFTQFFNNSYDLAKRVGGALGDLFVGLYNIGKLSDSLSGMMGRNLEEMFSNFREWTESKDGRQTIRQFFKDMRPVVRELTKWIGSLTEAVGDIALSGGTFVKWSRGLRKDVLPAVVDLIQTAQGFALPLVLQAAETYTNLKDAGVTGGLGRALNVFADGILAVSEAASNLPESTKNLVALATGLYAGYKILNRGAIGKGISAVTGGRFGKSGVTPVFVTNWPVGMGGKGGGVIGGGKGAPGSHRAPTRLDRLKGSFRGLGVGGLALGLGGAAMAGSDNQAVRSGGHAAMGASAGSMFGPWGAGIGAIGGAAAGAILDERAKMDEVKRKFNEDAMFIRERYTAIMEDQQKMQAQGFGPFWTPAQLEQSQDALRGLSDDFEKLTGESIANYNAKLNDLPKDVQTKIMTPGMLDSKREMDELLKRYDMTPKEKQTVMKLLGADESILKMKTLKEYIDRIQDKEVRINVMRTETLLTNNAGGIGKAGGVPGLFTGGATKRGQTYLTGEQGPEAWINKSGVIKMLGLKGPELASPGDGAVIPTSATYDPYKGDANKAPDWAVQAYQRAAGALARNSGAGASQAPSGNSYSLSVQVLNPQSEIDVTSAVKKAIREIEDERDERS